MTQLDPKLFPEGPRTELYDGADISCPWCGHDNEDGPAGDSNNGPGPFDCISCGKAFQFDVNEDGSLYTIGLITEADKRYAEWKASKC